jgi:hypothetical protein
MAQQSERRPVPVITARQQQRTGMSGYLGSWVVRITSALNLVKKHPAVSKDFCFT